MYSMHERLS